MAQALLQKAVADQGVAAEVTSGGILKIGEPATDNAISVMAQRGLDIQAHESRQLTAAMLDESDLVLTMERAHVREVAVRQVDALRRTFTVKEFLRRAVEAPPAQGQLVAEWLGLLALGRPLQTFMAPSAADDVADPIGQPREAYEATATELQGYMDGVARQLEAICT